MNEMMQNSKFKFSQPCLIVTLWMVEGRVVKTRWNNLKCFLLCLPLKFLCLMILILKKNNNQSKNLKLRA